MLACAVSVGRLMCMHSLVRCFVSAATLAHVGLLNVIVPAFEECSPCGHFKFVGEYASCHTMKQKNHLHPCVKCTRDCCKNVSGYV